MKTLSCALPRFAHPYGSNHMDRYVVFGSNVFSFFTALFCVPNIFSLVKSQFFRFFKLIQRMLHVAFSANVFKIPSSVVLFIAVYVVNLLACWPRPYKSGGDHRVNGFVIVGFVNTQRNKSIPVTSKRRFKDSFYRLVRRAAKYFAHYRLTNTYVRAYFSAAKTLFAKLPNQINLVFSQSSLRKIWAVGTFYLAKVANFVMPVKIWHWLPDLHLKTPNS